MYKSSWIILISLILGIAIPGVLASVAMAEHLPEETQPATTVFQPTTADTTAAAEEGVLLDIVDSDGLIMQLELEEYIVGVVLAEMPASFEYEALKAQAVVARTYTLKQRSAGHKHPQYAVCTDANCCQGYISKEAYLSKNGSYADVEKVCNAVEDTRGRVLTYEGMLIDATYFSCSGGRTEDAQAVWGADVPYLRSVESPGEEYSDHYIDTVTFSVSQFESGLNMDLSEFAEECFGEITYTNGGGVASIEIGGVVFDGITVRRLLGLKSTAFIITAVGDHITVTTKGFGHRVGMSQYGANAMASNGYNYSQILSHYYQGACLEVFAGD